MHTFTSLNWLASLPPEPESSHPVTDSEERLKNKCWQPIHLGYQRDPVTDIGDLTTHVCVYAPHLISQTERKTLPKFAI